jgi:glycosyltransferase involved in cell wall biosynthesis
MPSSVTDSSRPVASPDSGRQPVSGQPSGAIRIMTILEASSVTGPAKAVLEFAREASQPGAHPKIDLSIVTFLRRTKVNSFTETIKAIGLPLDVVAEQGRFDFGVIPQLREVVERRQPHIIWTNSVKSHFLIRWSGLNRKAKWVAFHHGYTTTDWKTRGYNYLDRWSHHGADRLVTVCGKFAKDLEKIVGIPAARIDVEHMPLRALGPVPPETAAAMRRSLGIAGDAMVLLSVGRLSKEKGHADFLRALALMRDAGEREPEVLLVGDGPERAALEALCAELRLHDSVHFPGHQADVRPFYGVADLFVLPSHSEGSPNVLLEAIDADVPIVATAVGGIPEIVENEVSALLVNRQDETALAMAIRRMLCDVALRDRLRSQARLVLAQHTPEQYFRHIAQVFETVLGHA